MLQFNKVSTLKETELISRLAKRIFHEIYDPIVPHDFTENYIQENQSVAAILEQMQHKNFEYYLVNFDSQTAGYIGYQYKKEKIFLSKFYILKEFRGNSIGSEALQFIENEIFKKNIPIIELFVNQLNKRAIEFYLKNGFTITKEMENKSHLFPDLTIMDYLMTKERI